MAHVEVGVGEVVDGGADGEKFCQEGLVEVLINLGEDWEEEGWLDGALEIDHPHRQG